MADIEISWTSPISDSLCGKQDTGQNRLVHESFGRWGLHTDYTERTHLASSKPYRYSHVALSVSQVKKALALMRSKVWLAERKQLPIPFLYLDGVIDKVGPTHDLTYVSGVGVVEPVEIGKLYQESRTLSLEVRAYYTLFNIRMAEPRIGIGIKIPFSMRIYPGARADFDLTSHETEGMIYGCDDDEAMIVLQFLKEQGYIDITSPMDDEGDTIRLTTKGYMFADRMSQGHENRAPKGFCVCRFKPDLDQVFEAVYKPVGIALECPIQRVKDIHHIEIITDRILREIREATLVVVDLTDENFNLGFEAGYALSLKKPIVFTIKKPAGELKLPFDIAGYNVLVYEPTLKGFYDAFYDRALVALNSSSPSPIPEIPVDLL